MSNSTKITWLLLTVLAVLCVAAVFVGVSFPDDFDQVYEDCEADNADLVLRVKYQIEGIEESKEYAANYRKRPRLTRLNEWWRQKLGLSITVTEYVGNGAYSGPGSERWHVYPIEVAEGVELTISHSLDSSERNVKVEECVMIPFPGDIQGQQGRITYVANWERH